MRDRLGVGVLVRAGRLVLLGRRKGSRGAGSWGPPGGAVEDGETPVVAARRELHEEAGLSVGPLIYVATTRDTFPDVTFTTLFFETQRPVWTYGESVEVLEPTKCEEWGWFDGGDLPSPLFKPVENLLATGYRFV